jgi:hypothetical protein
MAISNGSYAITVQRNEWKDSLLAFPNEAVPKLAKPITSQVNA